MQKLLLSVGISAVSYIIEQKRAEARRKQQFLDKAMDAVSNHGADAILKMIGK